MDEMMLLHREKGFRGDCYSSKGSSLLVYQEIKTAASCTIPVSFEAVSILGSCIASQAWFMSDCSWDELEFISSIASPGLD